MRSTVLTETLMNVPLCDLRVRARQISGQDRGAVARALFDFAFPRFFGRDAEVRPERLELPRDQTGGDPAFDMDLVTFSNNRRHSGDMLAAFGARESDLPRGRYYSLMGPDGSDRGLLRNELVAYTDFERTGGFLLLDGLLADNMAILGRSDTPNALYAWIKSGSPFQEGFCDFLHSRYDGVEMPDEATNILKGAGRDLVIGINCNEIELDARRVLDLRMPNARDWFARTFCKFADLGGLLDDDFIDFLVEEEPPGDRFENLLPGLCVLTQGGGWSTQVFGIVLRRLGVGALVFPSARCDPSVDLRDGDLRDGELVAWRGWNLVDYGGAPEPVDLSKSGYRFIQWAFTVEGVSAPVVGNTPCPEADETKRVLLVADRLWQNLEAPKISIGVVDAGANAGSFSVDGLDALSDAAATSWAAQA